MDEIREGVLVTTGGEKVYPLVSLIEIPRRSAKGPLSTCFLRHDLQLTGLASVYNAGVAGCGLACPVKVPAAEGAEVDGVRR